MRRRDLFPFVVLGLSGVLCLAASRFAPSDGAYVLLVALASAAFGAALVSIWEARP